MNWRSTLVCLMLSLAAGTVAYSQTPTPAPTPPEDGIWQARLGTGSYLVKLSAISSVSMHEYIVDGASRVTEVAIGTTGSEMARFYYIAPNTPSAPGGVGQSLVNSVEDKAKQAMEKLEAGGVTQSVIKNYPATTHAHTIEYRLSSKELLQKLFESVESALLNNKGSIFKP